MFLLARRPAMKPVFTSRLPPMFSSTVTELFSKPRATRRRATSGMVLASAVSTISFALGLDKGFDIGCVPPMQSQRIAIGQGPAHARGHVGERGEMGMMSISAEGNEFKQFPRNAIIHGVAGGEDNGLAST